VRKTGIETLVTLDNFLEWSCGPGQGFGSRKDHPSNKGIEEIVKRNEI
jgi:hypothetical protein